MDPGIGEFVLHVERLLVASDSLFVSSGNLGSTKMGRRLRTLVYRL